MLRVAPKKEGRKKERHPKQWQTGYSPGPSTSSDQNQTLALCMVGGLRCVVIHFKCDPNRLRGYGAVGGRKWPFPITLASGLYKSKSLYYRTSRDIAVYHGYNSVKCIIYKDQHRQFHQDVNGCILSTTSINVREVEWCFRRFRKPIW